MICDFYEAPVAGGIPIIKILRESVAGNRILSIHGIVNGTCNYILTRMRLKGRVQSDRPQVAVQVSVYPALVPNSHVLASVNFAFNAISVRGDVVGETLFPRRDKCGDAEGTRAHCPTVRSESSAGDDPGRGIFVRGNNPR
ncbi:MAG: hypothetical protein EXS36_15245 [Pedosphaera sp.]|nr:hypothetical protein [Pedosphaera sp.]